MTAKLTVGIDKEKSDMYNNKIYHLTINKMYKIKIAFVNVTAFAALLLVEGVGLWALIHVLSLPIK